MGGVYAWATNTVFEAQQVDFSPFTSNGGVSGQYKCVGLDFQASNSLFLSTFRSTDSNTSDLAVVRLKLSFARIL